MLPQLLDDTKETAKRQATSHHKKKTFYLMQKKLSITIWIVV